jgi:hypothetical protein
VNALRPSTLYSTASRGGASADAGGAAIVASVRTRNRAASVALACALVGVPAVALAASRPPQPKATSPLLWATVDVCDTATHPDTIGIRGSMPGTGDRQEQMYMRFVVEFRSPTGHWHYLKDGESALIAVGNGASKARQAGQDFQVARSASQSYTLRGVVVFEWRANGRTIAQAVRATHTGHTAAAGGDPPDYSAATCTIMRKAAGRS